MTEGFGELGVGEELLGVVEQLGFARPTAVQRAAIPVLRRGANVVMHAASGSGVTLAYGLALTERLREVDAGDGAVHALVLAPTEERSSAIALELGRLGRASGVSTSLLAPGWQSAARVVVAPTQRALSLLQSSALKLDELKVLVLHDVSAMIALGQLDTLDTLIPTVPRDAQRILVTSELTPAIEKLADAHIRKALHVPARPAVPEHAPAGASTVTIEYIVLAGPLGRQAVAEAVAAAGDTPVVLCRSRTDCRSLEDELALRGLVAQVRLYGAPTRTGETAIGLGAPLDTETLSSGLGRGGTVVLEATQLTHLRNLARQSQITLRAGSMRAGVDVAGLDRFRDTLRRALREEDVEAQLLVIEPLLQEFSAAEIAAAASALLRKRPAAPAEAQPRTTAGTGSAPPAFVKLFLSVGQRDTATAREIVGTITGEAGVSGEQVGKVEIRDTFSIVEVSADVADRVIRALNGTSLRGRSLRVDYDRKTGSPKRTMPPRRTPRP